MIHKYIHSKQSPSHHVARCRCPLCPSREKLVGGDGPEGDMHLWVCVILERFIWVCQIKYYETQMR